MPSHSKSLCLCNHCTSHWTTANISWLARKKLVKKLTQPSLADVQLHQPPWMLHTCNNTSHFWAFHLSGFGGIELGAGTRCRTITVQVLTQSPFWKTSPVWRPVGTWGCPPPSSSGARPTHPWLRLNAGSLLPVHSGQGQEFNYVSSRHGCSSTTPTV